MTITEFLKARIDEDEAESNVIAAMEDDDRGGWALAYAERVLAECAAKRAIIGHHTELCRSKPGSSHSWSTLGFVLEALAAVYADHADYKQEWAK